MVLQIFKWGQKYHENSSTDNSNFINTDRITRIDFERGDVWGHSVYNGSGINNRNIVRNWILAYSFKIKAIAVNQTRPMEWPIFWHFKLSLRIQV